MKFFLLILSVLISVPHSEAISQGDVVVHDLTKKIYRIDLEKNSVDGHAWALVLFDGNDVERNRSEPLPRWTFSDYKREHCDLELCEYVEDFRLDDVGLEQLYSTIPTSELMTKKKLLYHPSQILEVGQIVRNEQGELASLRLLFTNGDAFIVPISTYKTNPLTLPFGHQKEISRRQLVPAHTLVPVSGTFLGYHPRARVESFGLVNRCQALWPKALRRGESGRASGR